tara:strand:- start:2610 stop:3584 length:975 start_codon:yes stop_codon:yes gene_type:complete
MNNIIAITVGDVKGVGLEILIDSWKKKRIKNFILFTNIRVVSQNLKNKKINNKINIINEKNKYNKYSKDKFNIYSYKADSLEDNTYKSLKFAYKFCIKKICIGMITLPLRKDLIKKKINRNFIGQTEFFQKIDKKKYSNMILFHDKIIISPVTTHIKLKDVSKKVSQKKFLYNQLINLNNTLKIDFNISKPKIVISGLNPHAGENGNIGKEEIFYINPEVKRLRKKGIIIDGPLSPDSILIKNNLKKYNCFVFLFHDQALIPFKYISQFSGVNYTGNLNIIRTSPDHGTAYDLVGTNKISNKSFMNCYKLIKKIYKNRMINDKS